MQFSKAVVKYRVPILILALLLMIPSAVGMAKTRINYDMLDYLPEDMDTVIGQNDLMEDFGKGAFSFIVVDGMTDRDVDSLCERIKQVEHVETVLWYSSLADITIPKELLPDSIYNEFNNGDSTLVASVFGQRNFRGCHHGRDKADTFRVRQPMLRFRHVRACHRP